MLETVASYALVVVTIVCPICLWTWLWFRKGIAPECPYKYGNEYWAVRKILGDYKVCPVVCDSIMYRDDLTKDCIWVAQFTSRDGSNPITVTSADVNYTVFESRKEASENLGLMKLARKYAELEVVRL